MTNAIIEMCKHLGLEFHRIPFSHLLCVVFSSWSRDCEMHSHFNKILTMIDKLFLSPLLNNSRVYERTKRRASSLPCGQTRRLKSISIFWKSWKCVSNKKSQRHSISHRKGSVGMCTVGAKPSNESFTPEKLDVTKINANVTAMGLLAKDGPCPNA